MPDVDVVIQAMLTMNVLKATEASTAIKGAMDGNKARGVQFVADRILNAPATGRGRGGPALSTEQQNSLDRGGTIYTEVCLRVPRRRRTRHANAGSGRRVDARSVTGRIPAGQRPSRLRHQGGHAWPYRTSGQ